MIVLHFRIYVSFIISYASKIPECIAVSLTFQVDPQIQKSQTVKALNVNQSVNQSEGIRAWFVPVSDTEI